MTERDHMLVLIILLPVVNINKTSVDGSSRGKQVWHRWYLFYLSVVTGNLFTQFLEATYVKQLVARFGAKF